MIKNIITRIVALGKVKLIAGGLAAIIAVSGVGAVVYHNNASKIAESTCQHVKSKSERISDLKDAYSKCAEDIEKIINVDTVYEPMKKDLDEICILINSLSEESEDESIENAESRIESMINGLNEYMEKSLDILLKKEDELNSIDISSISDDIKNNISSQNEEYYDLKNDKNYKMADCKINEIINFVRNAVQKPSNGNATEGESVSNLAISRNNDGAAKETPASNPNNTESQKNSSPSGNNTKKDTLSNSEASKKNSEASKKNSEASKKNSEASKKNSYPVMSWTTYKGMVGFFVSPSTDPYDALNFTNRMAAEHPEILNMSMVSVDAGNGYVFEGWK